MSNQRIALALSGGGYRATYYHLGVIRCLRDYGVLKDVKVITSVSGGSILAAHLVLNWSQFNGTSEEFDKAASELLTLSDSDFRNAETRMLPWRAVFGRFLGNTSDGAKNTYADKLFESKTLGDLAGNRASPSPKLFILATDLNKPTCTVSFSSDGIRFHDTESTDYVETSAVTVATAVTASAAFPPFFVPVHIDAATTGAKEGQLPHQPVCLTDGGVRDNSGACILRSVAEENKAETLLVSDASRAMDLDRKTDYSRSRKQTLLRVLDILQTRVADEVASKAVAAEGEAAEKETWIRITDRIDSKYCTAELQNDIASIRTDLDRFSAGEVAALYHLGYAQTEVSTIVRNKKAKKDRLKAFGDAMGSSIPQRLEDSRKVRSRWIASDWASLANCVVLLLTLVVVVLLGWHLWGVLSRHLLTYASNDLGYALVLDDDSLCDLRALSNGESDENGRQYGPAVQTRTLTLQKLDDSLNTIRIRMASSQTITAACLTHRYVVVNVAEEASSGENTFSTKLDVVVDVSEHKIDDQFQVIVVGVNKGGFSGATGEFAASRTSPGKTNRKRIRVLLPSNRTVSKGKDGRFLIEEMYVKESRPGEAKQEYMPFDGPGAKVSVDGNQIEWEILSSDIKPYHAYRLGWKWQDSLLRSTP